MKHDYILNYPDFGKVKFDGKPDDVVRFVIKNQLM